MKSKKGFSLLEVIVAVAIMAISFTALLNFQGQSTARVGLAEQMTTATLLAEQKMAEVLLEIDKEIVQQRVFPEEKSESGNFEEPHEKYRWEWKIRKVGIPLPGGEEGSPEVAMFAMVADQIKDSVREITLTVFWKIRGKERSFDVVTHITKL